MYRFVLVVQVSARVFPCKDYGNFCQVKDFVAYGTKGSLVRDLPGSPFVVALRK